MGKGALQHVKSRAYGCRWVDAYSVPQTIDDYSPRARSAADMIRLVANVYPKAS